AAELERVGGHVKFNDVTFHYGRGEGVIEAFNLEVAPGEHVGLVGPSGAGKTTLVNMLLRLYDVEGGKITLDGHDIREVTQASLRDQFGVVSQDPMLMHRSIRDNIAYGRPDASQAEIEAAAAKANAHSFITSFPQGYDTIVGERGIQLSGGQRQRIAIARAVLKDPAILILDEATSALDSESERLVQDALDQLMKGRTSIVIAHRLSTVRDADRILVLDKGRVLESGTHDELIADVNGLYHSLSRLQLEA
ncbi:MAG: ATP-binding cassette domain-containing protein, partial [Flavobacteriales bacterium]|nr:ATP-binding cassette domain-containing protein [Flavobacteriales bacterium]